MRKSFSIARAYSVRPLFTAVLAVATAFTLSCTCDCDDGGGKDPSSASVVEPSSSSAILYSSSLGQSSSSAVVPSSSSVAECNGTPYNAATHFCDNNTIYEKCGGTLIYNPATEECCGKGKYTLATQFCDLRDSTAYKWKKIGTQTWMAENLNYNASGSKCNQNNTVNCATYGKLYDWATAMANSASSVAIPSGVQGVCPLGWHLPSDAEWNVLTTFAGSNAGTKLKAKSGWIDNGIGTDDYGFSALPGGGVLDGDFRYDYIGDYGYWWSATQGNEASLAHYLYIRYSDTDVSVGDAAKTELFSVRCLKD